MPHLVFSTADGRQRRVPLSKAADRYMVGSDDACDVVLAGAAAKHVVVAWVEGEWCVRHRREHAVHLNGEPCPQTHALRDGDEIALGHDARLTFRDASAWVAAVAPWASAGAATTVEALAGPLISTSPGRGFSRPMAFDLGGSGMSAGWHDDLVVVSADRPPGPERIVIEAWPHEAALIEGAVRERVADAREAAFAQVDTSSWRSAADFAWLALGGGQRTALRWRWRRGSFTNTVVLPSDDGGCVVVSLTSADADPSTSARLRPFLRSFCFAARCADATTRCALVLGDEVVRLDDEVPLYTIGGERHREVMIADAAPLVASLRSDGGAWRLVAEHHELGRVRVNGSLLDATGRVLFDGDEVGIETPAGRTSIRFWDQVIRREPPPHRPGAPNATLRVPPPERDWSHPLWMKGADPTKFNVTLWQEPRLIVAAMNLKGLGTSRPQEGHIEVCASVGAIVVEPCPSSHPVMCLNVALAKKAGRVLAYSDAARPDLFGEPCNLPIGQPHAAVIVDDDTCVAVVEEPSGHGALVTLRGPIVRHGRCCRSLSPFLNRALSSWL